MRRKRSRKFSRIENNILNRLYWAQRAMSTSEVADRTRISWNTAMKYLTRLRGKGYVRRRKKGNTIYWWLTTI